MAKRTLPAIELRQSTLRSETLADDFDQTGDRATEIRTEMRTLEAERRELLTAAAPTDDKPADKDFVELETRAQLTDIAGSVLGSGAVQGATAELQAELGLAGDQVPLSLLRRTPAVEKRTTGFTPIPGNHGEVQQPIIPSIWPQSATAFANVEMPVAGVGDEVFTIVSTDFTAGSPAEGADQGDSTGGFTATVVNPHRIQVSAFFRIEDRARLAGLESAMRMNASDAVADKMDAMVFDDADGGFFATGVLTAAPTGDGGTEAAFADYRAFAYDAVDGKYASTVDGIRLVLGSKTYAHCSSQYRANSSDDSALDSLGRVTGGVRVSAHVPDPSSDVQGVLVVVNTTARHAVAPIWEGPQLIVDPYTQSKAGEVRLTLVMLWGSLNVIRKAGYSFRKAKLVT